MKPSGSNEWGSGHRISKKSDFLSLKTNSNRIKGRVISVVWKPGSSELTRLAFAVSGKVLRAVGRNRLRRITRELFRQELRRDRSFDALVILNRRAFSSKATSLDQAAVLEIRSEIRKAIHHLNNCKLGLT